MTIIEGRQLFRDRLKEEFEKFEIDFYFKTLLIDRFDRAPTVLALDPHSELLTSEAIFIEAAISQLLKHRPLQYILGKAHFRNLNLKVDERVLIPRPETEELVDWILEDHFEIKEKPMKLLDMGTGSGCIAIALAKEKEQFLVSALDCDAEILELTQENAQANGVKINCIHQDMNQMEGVDMELDIIVSNPPYVLPQEKKQMKANVLEYEPHQALFVPQEDPLIFYRLILEFAVSNLKPKGFIYFEINPMVNQSLKDLINSFSYTILERIDIFGKVRMMRLQKK
ncbi:MAG: peptide chain release factor N(5)-glutamine methyltransferase [Flavobacteriaceae bacterium]